MKGQWAPRRHELQDWCFPGWQKKIELLASSSVSSSLLTPSTTSKWPSDKISCFPTAAQQLPWQPKFCRETPDTSAEVISTLGEPNSLNTLLSLKGLASDRARCQNKKSGSRTRDWLWDCVGRLKYVEIGWDGEVKKTKGQWERTYVRRASPTAGL